MISSNLSYKTVEEKYSTLIETADIFNITTGFVSNDSIIELSDLLRYRQSVNRKMTLNLLIGMNFLDKFTRVQYEGIRELSEYMNTDNLGKIYVSDKVRFHGKMYSFIKQKKCEAAFVGSSNLGSFIGTSKDLIESDIFVDGKDAEFLNHKICALMHILGRDFRFLEPITDFREPVFNLLDNTSFVDKLSREKLQELLGKQSGLKIEIPFKVGSKYEKSNLNPYFGAGKNKNKFAPRSWYEVELILGKNLPLRDEIPQQFTVVTDDGYKFDCKRQGTNLKNFRSADDLKILGKWIKGHMEAEGCLKLKERVTPETLEKFKKTGLVLSKTTENNIWLLKMV